MSEDSGSSAGSEVCDPLDGSGSGNGAASGDGWGAGSSKAGRAWCQGASELRGVVGALPGRLSPRSDPARWLVLPSDALRARRDPSDAAGAPGVWGSEPGASDSEPAATGSEPAVGDAWSLRC
ncbi:hypothetical protein [Streptomyces cahuitamycinicus]|uniref:hypothetical protein n=1 Tax=Streptomyces cahuitamycinicus TaxID=2070367 RepID=UPI000C9CBDE8|nr:hypothetical protein [Streptomyces cahuitamycinicus]